MPQKLACGMGVGESSEEKLPAPTLRRLRPVAALIKTKIRKMRLRSFIIGYALVPALLLFALPRHPPLQPNHYSHVLDLTEAAITNNGVSAQSRTRIISPAAMVPGTWAAAQIPVERLIGPLVVIELKTSST